MYLAFTGGMVYALYSLYTGRYIMNKNEIIDVLRALFKGFNLRFVLITVTCMALFVFVAEAGHAIKNKKDKYTELSQAYYMAKGGVEYAKFLKDRGFDVEVKDKAFAKGSFSIVEKPDKKSVVVRAKVGETEMRLEE